MSVGLSETKPNKAFCGLNPTENFRSKKETTLIPGAIVDCGSGLQPRFTQSYKHLQLSFHKSTAPDKRTAGLIKARNSDHALMIPLPAGHEPFVRIVAPANALSANATIRTKALRELRALAVQPFPF
jgi:hypothetical protein